MNGECLDLQDGYRCNCEEGWRGQNCGGEHYIPVGNKCTLSALESKFSRLEVALDYNVFVTFLSTDSSPTTAKD